MNNADPAKDCEAFGFTLKRTPGHKKTNERSKKVLYDKSSYGRVSYSISRSLEKTVSCVIALAFIEYELY